MNLEVNIDETSKDTLQRAKLLLEGILGAVGKAVGNALDRAGSNMRTNAVKAIKEKYDISAAAVKDSKNVKFKRTFVNSGDIKLELNFNGHKIPLHRYGGSSPKIPRFDKNKLIPVMIKGKWRKVHPSVAAKGHQLKDTAPSTIEGAFAARLSNGHIGLFQRTGSGGESIKEVKGSSVPQMLGNIEVAENLTKEAAAKFDERLEHEITRILNGY